eukprot:1159075-Pelagomonas_calceolata.AAC.5
MKDSTHESLEARIAIERQCLCVPLSYSCQPNTSNIHRLHAKKQQPVDAKWPPSQEGQAVHQSPSLGCALDANGIMWRRLGICSSENTLEMGLADPFYSLAHHLQAAFQGLQQRGHSLALICVCPHHLRT